MTETPAAPAAPAVPAAARSWRLFLVLGILSVLSLAANVWGGLNFPGNAPVEQAICFGILVDLVAVLILSLIGLVVARQNLAVRPSSVLAIVGIFLTGLALALILVTAWVPSAVDVGNGIRLHYAAETFATFAAAPLWVTGLAFGAFAYRRGGTSANNVLALLSVAFGVVIFVGAAASAVIYGLGIST